MTAAHPLVLVMIVGGASAILVGLVRRYAIAHGILDTPKARSSHRLPTPRGGGLGLVAAVLGGYLAFAPAGSLDLRLVVALVGVIPTALAGWFDDRGPVSVRLRFAAHVSSGMLLLPLAVGVREQPMIMVLIALFWLVATVSAINVVNFIDGIDGLIGSYALMFGAHLAWLATPESRGGMLGLSLAAGALGFLIWNWPPARIFLGDVGSGAIAVIGVIAGILVWDEGTRPFLSVFLPLFPIFLDALVTIARRTRRGESLQTAHRTHLYQRLAMEGRWGHARVSLLYLGAGALGSLVARVLSVHVVTATVAYGIGICVLGLILDKRFTGGPRPI